MGIHIVAGYQNLIDAQNRGFPIIPGGGWPLGATPAPMNALWRSVSQTGLYTISFVLRSFLPGSSINVNSIQVLVQPLPASTYMSFLIDPIVTGSGTHLTIQFSLGNQLGDIVNTLNQVTISAADNQGTQGAFQFYYSNQT